MELKQKKQFIIEEKQRMNRVPFCKGPNQTIPPFYLNGRKAQNQPLQYQNHQEERKFDQSPQEIKYMKFRRWQSQEYFVEIGKEVLKLGEKRFKESSQQLQGRVQVNGRWAIYNWVIEFESLMFWARADDSYLSNSETNNRNKSIGSLLQLQFEYIDKIESMKNNKGIKLNRCLEFLLKQLSTAQFYSLQFLVKLLKINEFYRSMKAFSQTVRKFETQFNCFNSFGNSGNNKFHNNNSKAIDQYGEIFYLKNEPQLKRIKQQILNIVQNYQLSLMICETNTNWYEIEICIKLLRAQVYKQEISIQQKQHQFEFLIINSGIDQTLTKISQLREMKKSDLFLRRDNIIKVSQLIKIYDRIVDTATQIIEQKPNHKMKASQHQCLKISSSVHDINSDNSNSIIEEKTQKLPHTDMNINTLGFSKSFQVSNSNQTLQNKNNSDHNQFNNNINTYTNHLDTYNNNNIIQQKHDKNLLEMLQDQKTIRENFSLLSVNQIKKQKRIKKMSRKRQLYKFQCVNGKITHSNKNQNQNEELNDIHSIRNKYKQKRLQQLQDKKKRYKEHSTKHDSIQQEHKQQQNQPNQTNINFTIQENNQQLSPHQLKNSSLSPNQHKKSDSLKYHSSPQEEKNQSQKVIFATPIKDKSVFGFMHLPSIGFQQQDQLNFNNINKKPIEINKIINEPVYKPIKNIQQQNCSFIKRDENSNMKSASNDKTMNFKESYKLANNRFAPLSRTNTSINRFNPKMSFIRKNKTNSRHLRASLQPSSLQMTYFKKLHQPRFDNKYMASYEDDQFLVDDTPPKYKKTKVTNQ